MATVTSLTAARMLAIEASSVVSGVVNGTGKLILTTHDGVTQDAGNVVGPVGPPGPVSWASIPDKPLSFPPLAMDSLTLASTAIDFPKGISTMFVSPTVGSPTPANFGSLTTIRPYDNSTAGGTTQYWTSYQSNDNTVYYRQWFYLASAWSSWSSSTTPPGVMQEFAGTVAPAGYLFARGQAESRTVYARLFAVVGTQFGVGDGSTTFNVPNRSGRVAVGYDAAQTEFNAIAKVGGAKTHTLTVAESASHTHVQNAHAHNLGPSANFHTFRWGAGEGANVYVAGVNVTAGSPPANELSTIQNWTTNWAIENTAVNQSTGGGGAHNNIQPYLTLNYIIKT